MSVVRNHILLGKQYAVPVFLGLESFGFSGSTSTITPSSGAPANGTLLVMTVHGTTSRTLSSISTSGWTQQDVSGAGTAFLLWKIASGEPSSWTVTLSGTATGILYSRYSNVEQTNPVATFVEASHAAAGPTSQALPAYDVVRPSVAVSWCVNNAGLQWSANNGFTSGGPTVARQAYKVYSNPAYNEVITWSGATSTGAQKFGLVVFKGRKF